MSEDPGAGENTTAGGITVLHLALVMSFFMAFFAPFGAIKSAGGGIVRYLWGSVLALVLGCAVIAVNWQMLNLFSRISQRRSIRTQNLLGIAALIVEFSWGIAGIVAGSALTGALIEHGKL